MNDNAAMNFIETTGPGVLTVSTLAPGHRAALEALADIFDAMGGVEGGGYRPDEADKVWGYARAALIANGVPTDNACDYVGWFTDGAARPTVNPSPLNWCPRCGPCQHTDDAGDCPSCGAPAVAWNTLISQIRPYSTLPDYDLTYYVDRLVESPRIAAFFKAQRTPDQEAMDNANELMAAGNALAELLQEMPHAQLAVARWTKIAWATEKALADEPDDRQGE